MFGAAALAKWCLIASVVCMSESDPRISLGIPVFDYTQSTSMVDIDGAITGTEGIVAVPDLASSSFEVDAVLSSVGSGGGKTIAIFTNGTISITDIVGLLLSGTFDEMTVGGTDGQPMTASATVTVTGGSLAAVFKPTVLFEVHTSSIITSQLIFNADFSGVGSGKVINTPEISLETVSHPPDDPLVEYFSRGMFGNY